MAQERDPAGKAGETAGPWALPTRLRPWLPPLAIALVVLAFFTPFLFQGKLFLAADTLYQFYPWKSYAPPGFVAHNTLITDPVNMNYSFSHLYNQALKQAQFVTWSPNILGGIPVSGGRNYPFNLLLHGLLPTHVALTLSLLVHLSMMGWFMYRYLREIGAGDRGAVFGGVVYAFNGCAMVWLSFETFIPHAAYVPLLLLLMERFQGPRRFFNALLGALVLGLVLLLGHIQYTLYVGMILLFYGAFLVGRAALRGAGAEIASLAACGAITAGGGLLLGVVELLPAYEVISYSSRASRTFDFAGLFNTLGSLPYRWLVTLVFPDYFGSPVLRIGAFPSAPKEYLNYNELCLYMGVPTLFAFLALALRPRTAHARFFLGLTVVTTAMLAGSFLFYPFFALLPGMDKLNPTRMLFIFVFAAAATAGLGLRNLEEARGGWRRVQLGGILALTGAIVVLAFASSSSGVITFFSGGHLGAGAEGQWYSGQLRALRALSSPVIAKPLVIALLSGALFWLWVRFGERRWAALLPALLLTILAFDLITFGWNYNTLVEPRHIYPMTPSLEFLRKQPGPFRVVQDAGRGLYVNVLQPYGIQEVGGYANVYPERVNKYLSFAEYGPASFRGALFDRWVMFRNVTSPLLDVFNVKYVLTAPGVRLPEGQGYRLVFNQDLAIYENLRALPRAFAVHRPVLLKETNEIISYMASGRFDPRAEVILEEEPAAVLAARGGASAAPSTVSVERYRFDEVKLGAEMAADGWVVLADSYYPGWEATVDGAPARILRADCTLRAVAVPAGRHTVVFRYRPRAILVGRLVSLAALLLVLGGLVVTRRPRSAAPGGPGPAES